MSNHHRPIFLVASSILLVACGAGDFQCDSVAVVNDVKQQSKAFFTTRLIAEYQSGVQAWPVRDEQGNIDESIDLSAPNALERYAAQQADLLKFIYGRQAHKNYLDKELTCIGRLETPVGAQVPLSYLVKQNASGSIAVEIRP
ncbi:MAG: hypothetical protein LAT77_00720 [Aliidiomarina sp.]|uniref:hypothetical protein n=1 Tax=Aliidiomarina sp. TaxID=1872439 RepID=UPI0025BED8CD|nr:hypothetical protein [Aliidiomarina sp.]MCH8500414.1 hypothetical protein [Aliidiomarina sp.]